MKQNSMVRTGLLSKLCDSGDLLPCQYVFFLTFLIRDADFDKKVQPFYLYNFRARWYSSYIGRWLSKDPIGLEGGLNLYTFCGNDPVNYRDPWGLCADDSKDTPLSPLLLLGGVKRNLTVNTPNGPLTTRSSVDAIEAALRSAKTPGMKKALNALLKVVKRGGTGGSTATRMGGGLLGWVPGLMSDAKVIGDSLGRGESLDSGYRREFENEGPYILTPIGVFPNVWWSERVNSMGGHGPLSI